ncbi:MAG: hypothetical protein A3K19_06735 [Lentisphaerae bacterium RIFOXYB12_FULL_65_16]|nr:MAG: hypothetical protein A3K18_22035 [Lentisphaerae bacterium RIFOXYA12_64_32]OGV93146.1 MAG: hypothetical protein A3K19_06735 [Lentisphaerae bacterium RIFOXYB12_FULL_65_16]
MPTRVRKISVMEVAMLALSLTALQGCTTSRAAPETPAFEARVEAEETVCCPPAYEVTNNGSGMFWGSGSTQIVRLGDKLFVSAFEAVPGVAPLNNARWALYERGPDGWRLCQRDEKDRTREPCPLGVSQAGRLLMSVNPTLAPPVPMPPVASEAKATGGPARPEFLEFDPARPEQEPKHWVPQWDDAPQFTDHSYRAFAADGKNSEFILFNKIGSTHSEWAFLDKHGGWKTGQLAWPKGEDPKFSVWGGPGTPVNYANAILAGRQVYYLGGSPLNIWNRIDPANTETWGRSKWGWRMRKLHCTWTPDVTSTPFSEWVVLDDTMDDGGTIGMGDSWLAPDGRLHVVWQKEPINPQLRDLHFPDIKRDWHVCYGILKDGKLLEKRVVLSGGETTGPLHPTGYIGHPRLHITPDLTLYILCNLVGTTPETRPQTGTYAMRIGRDGSISAPVRIPLARPIPGSFFTASPRAGCPLTEAADLLIADTIDGKPVARYARVRFVPPCSPSVTVEGALALTPGEGRTIHLTARVSDPQNDPATVEWRLPDGETRQGPTLEWTAPETGNRFAIKVTARDPQGNEGHTTTIVSLPPPELAATKDFVRVEAEDFTNQGGGEAKVCHPVGASASISYWHKDIGHWLEWEFSTPADGRYELWMRYTTPGKPRRALLLDGQSPGPEFADIAIPGTGGWCSDTDNWAYMKLGSALALSAGKHCVRMTNLADGLGVDFFVLHPLP